ncbi:seryl-tRNA synthetase [Tieghemostelium lacteum]|uniref:serine--tRNA ligase n=1 Tax=Tieghemostelium lacteum TaxID=361077 RepID=A0A152A613_TIELA|nr:seryl-tRNA synthetase [Tieghemostelium lacteum]|eukprot:KYR01674.1 seryl-tRNA synthetase [Tieghemostelium lacteum]
MVLDIRLFRIEKGGNPDLIKYSQRGRFKDVGQVDEVIELDNKTKEANYQLSQLNAEFKKHNKEVSLKIKSGESVDNLKKQSELMRGDIQKLEKQVEELEKQLQCLLKQIGNILHASVPCCQNENDNIHIRAWGECKTSPDLLQHNVLLDLIDGYEGEKGAVTTGTRGYFLKGIGVLLNQAIINFAMAHLHKRDYVPLQTPFFMRKDVMSETVQADQFTEQLYKISGHTDQVSEDTVEKYLIGTSEQPLSAYHRGEWLDEKELPKKYLGYSTCFRKESKDMSKDCVGIFRVHQFEKIEQFCLTEPEKSWDMHEEMLKNAEAFYQDLGIPYQIVSVVSGALNNATSKKYDLEGWFPGSGNYRELVSCSNCTDYQSRELEIRCGSKKPNQTAKKYVHMLNCTLAATSRVICCILENYQTEGGINVPKALIPYLGMDFIPFVKPIPDQKKKISLNK